MRLAAAFAVLASPVLAEGCPEPGDLPGGIVVGLSDNSKTIYDTGEGVPPDQVREHTTFVNTPEALTLFAYRGILPLNSFQSDAGGPLPGSESRTDWVGAEAVYPLTQAKTINLEGTEVKGRSQTAVRLTVRADKARELRLSGCPVTAVPVEMLYRYPNGFADRSLVEYLPAFGIAIYVGGGSPTEAPWRYQITEFRKSDP